MTFELTKLLFFALVFWLGFMQPYIYIGKFVIPLTDIIFLLTFVVWILSLFFRQTQFRPHKFYLLLFFYFLAMLLSAFFSNDYQTSLFKLSGEIYLLSLPILTFNLIRTETDVQRVLRTWLVATACVVTVGFLSVFLFYFDSGNWLIRYTLFHYGTLPPGNYPRLQSTFLNANMLSNYLSVSLMFLLISRKLEWLNKAVFYALLFGILFCALLTISPGLGGIALGVGIWHWLSYQQSRRILALTALIFGCFFGLALLLALIIAPNLPSTSPFFINIPLIEQQIAPSSRALAWIDSWRTFMEYPFFGRGLGLEACSIHYLDLSGRLQTLTDAHNIFLNVAAQTGIFGLLAIIAIIFYITRNTFPLIFENRKENILRIGFGIAFMSAFVYQGIGGSFEDARHLWLLIGLFLAGTNLPESAE